MYPTVYYFECFTKKWKIRHTFPIILRIYLISLLKEPQPKKWKQKLVLVETKMGAVYQVVTKGERSIISGWIFLLKKCGNHKQNVDDKLAVYSRPSKIKNVGKVNTE